MVGARRVIIRRCLHSNRNTLCRNSNNNRLIPIRISITYRSHGSLKPGSKSSSPNSRPTSQPTPQSTQTHDHVPLKSFFIGTLAGITGSLVGLGGGFIMIPLMTAPSVLSLGQHIAHGTSLFAVTTTGLAGGLSYAMDGNVNFYSAGAIALSGMVSARFGAKFSNRLSQTQLKKTLGAFMIAVAPIVPLKPYLESFHRETNQSSKEQANETYPKDYRKKIVGISSCIGIFSGFMAGLLGVGGGAVVVPALTLFTPMDHYTALGTSLAAMGLPAAAGTLTHFQAGNVHGKVAPFLALGSLMGAYAGGRMGVKMEEEALRLGFSGIMVTLGIRTLVKA